MENNKIGKVELSTALDGRKKSHFNLSHDVSTTCGFGEVQPILYRHLRPNESFNVDFSSLIRLAPMVAPTWSRLYFKHWTQFVPMSDIFPNYASLLSQQAISRGTNAFATQKLPSISIAALSSLILAKVGIEGVNSNLATALRTIVVLAMAWGMVFLTHAQSGITQISKKSWLFLILSGLATGASWLCYYRALQLGEASKVVPVDKLSVVIALVLAFVFLHESFTMKSVVGAVLITAGTLIMVL